MGEDSLILPINNYIKNCNNILSLNKKSADNNKYNDKLKLPSKLFFNFLLIKRKLKLSSLVIGIIVISVLVFFFIGPVLAVPTIMKNTNNSASVLEEFYIENSYRGLNDQHDELEIVKKSIVEGLGLKRIPDPSKANVSQSEYERAHGEYLRRLQMSRAPGDRRTRKLHTFLATDIERKIERRIKKRETLDEIRRIYLPQMPLKDDEEAEVDHASLRFVLTSSLKNDDIKIKIYRLEKSSRQLIKSEIYHDFTGPKWIEFDVTNTARLWHENKENNNGLEIHIKSKKKKNTFININNNNLYFNIFISKLNSNLRKRRSPTDNLMSYHRDRKAECRGNNNKKCCRHEMIVIFKDLKGFEFIVQPKSFDAGYCKGRCPPRYNPANHHAVLQSLIWKENKSKAPRPCCAPNKLTELEILFIDDNDPTKLKISSWKNMRVLECACS